VEELLALPPPLPLLLPLVKECFLLSDLDVEREAERDLEREYDLERERELLE